MSGKNWVYNISTGRWTSLSGCLPMWIRRRSNGNFWVRNSWERRRRCSLPPSPAACSTSWPSVDSENEIGWRSSIPCLGLEMKWSAWPLSVARETVAEGERRKRREIIMGERERIKRERMKTWTKRVSHAGITKLYTLAGMLTWWHNLDLKWKVVPLYDVYHYLKWNNKKFKKILDGWYHLFILKIFV